MPKSRLNDYLFDSSFTKFSLKWCITRRCTVSVLRQDYDQCFIKQWRQTDCKVQQRPASWLGYSFQYITDIPACIRHVDIDLWISDTPSHVYAEFWTCIIYSSLFHIFMFFVIYFQRFSTSKEESFWIRIEKRLRVLECNFNQSRFLEEKKFQTRDSRVKWSHFVPLPVYKTRLKAWSSFWDFCVNHTVKALKVLQNHKTFLWSSHRLQWSAEKRQAKVFRKEHRENASVKNRTCLSRSQKNGGLGTSKLSNVLGAKVLFKKCKIERYIIRKYA